MLFGREVCLLLVQIVACLAPSWDQTAHSMCTPGLPRHPWSAATIWATQVLDPSASNLASPPPSLVQFTRDLDRGCPRPQCDPYAAVPPPLLSPVRAHLTEALARGGAISTLLDWLRVNTEASGSAATFLAILQAETAVALVALAATSSTAFEALETGRAAEVASALVHAAPPPPEPGNSGWCVAHGARLGTIMCLLAFMVGPREEGAIVSTAGQRSMEAAVKLLASPAIPTAAAWAATLPTRDRLAGFSISADALPQNQPSPYALLVGPGGAARNGGGLSAGVLDRLMASVATLGRTDRPFFRATSAHDATTPQPAAVEEPRGILGSIFGVRSADSAPTPAPAPVPSARRHGLLRPSLRCLASAGAVGAGGGPPLVQIAVLGSLKALVQALPHECAEGGAEAWVALTGPSFLRGGKRALEEWEAAAGAGQPPSAAAASAVAWCEVHDHAAAVLHRVLLSAPPSSSPSRDLRARVLKEVSHALHVPSLPGPGGEKAPRTNSSASAALGSGTSGSSSSSSSSSSGGGAWGGKLAAIRAARWLKALVVAPTADGGTLRSRQDDDSIWAEPEDPAVESAPRPTQADLPPLPAEWLSRGLGVDAVVAVARVALEATAAPSASSGALGLDCALNIALLTFLQALTVSAPSRDSVRARRSFLAFL